MQVFGYGERKKVRNEVIEKTVDVVEAAKSLTQKEQIELQYLYLLGYRYIAKDKNRAAQVWECKPERTPVCWMSKEVFPVRKQFLEHGKYLFLEWEHEPVKISDLVDVSGLTK
ncbi:hypothetical protein FT641_18940 [Bacillus paranthracis]|uniref:hypothetical protein n=1 Tax=Bacillus paranthracis TaxID=2026186 RepID=UPI001879DC1D|nr:hypothetical protein [Bacillus paranthracis]MBE7114358.1 hypothetical protein [Bacillus paranthracis]MBE7154769.1 hypothetical protein [Bacillus paranthracis]